MIIEQADNVMIQNAEDQWSIV